MGTWGYKPLDNDFAADLSGEFNDSKDITLLEQAFDAINSLGTEQYLEAPDAEGAVAAAQILKDLGSNDITEEDRIRLREKSKKALRRILENSELKDLWAESDEYEGWVFSVESLILQ